MPQPARLSERAERTRSTILETAERLFAEKGFDGTRLEEVAEAVGIRRASIVYYFRDKRELYSAVLESLFGGFLTRIEATLNAPGTLSARIEAAVCEWVEYVGARPALARILLREVADATPEQRPALLDQIQPFVDVVRRFVEQRPRGELPAQAPIDPVHVASAIAGATVFFVAVMPTLLPDLRFDPLSREHLETHRAEMLRITRRLLGISGPRPAPPPNQEKNPA